MIRERTYPSDKWTTENPLSRIDLLEITVEMLKKENRIMREELNKIADLGRLAHSTACFAARGK